MYGYVLNSKVYFAIATSTATTSCRESLHGEEEEKIELVNSSSTDIIYIIYIYMIYII